MNEGTPDQDDARRRLPKIELLPAECQIEAETAAFDVVVGGTGLIGRWAQIRGAGGREYGVITWTNGRRIETDAFGGDLDKIADAIRPSVPLPSAGS